MMAVVDAKRRFSWAASGFRGNSRDSKLFQGTKLYNIILNVYFIPQVLKNLGEKIFNQCEFEILNFL